MFRFRLMFAGRGLNDYLMDTWEILTIGNIRSFVKNIWLLFSCWKRRARMFVSSHIRRFLKIVGLNLQHLRTMKRFRIYLCVRVSKSTGFDHPTSTCEDLSRNPRAAAAQPRITWAAPGHLWQAKCPLPVNAFTQNLLPG